MISILLWINLQRWHIFILDINTIFKEEMKRLYFDNICWYYSLLDDIILLSRMSIHIKDLKILFWDIEGRYQTFFYLPPSNQWSKKKKSIKFESSICDVPSIINKMIESYIYCEVQFAYNNILHILEYRLEYNIVPG